jgi:hypothetical protein
MKRLLFWTLLAALALATGLAADSHNPSSTEGVTILGVTQRNTGCAILEKHTPVKGKLLAVGVIYARTEYRVLETFHCKLPRQKFTGAGEVKELNELAAKDRIKLAVLSPHYTGDQMSAARKACGAPPEAATSPPAN